MKTIKIERRRAHVIHAEVYPFEVAGAQYIGTGSVYTCKGPHSPFCGCAEDDIYAVYYLVKKPGSIMRRVNIKLDDEQQEELLREATA